MCFSNLILTIILFGRYRFYLHSTDEGTETQRLQVSQKLNQDINQAPMPIFLNLCVILPQGKSKFSSLSLQ